MECSCECDWYGDGEPVQMFSEWSPVARKEHACCECGQAIKTGTKYHRQKGLCDGLWFEDITCLPCKSIRDDFAPCAIPGDMACEVAECLGFNIFAPISEIGGGDE